MLEIEDGVERYYRRDRHRGYCLGRAEASVILAREILGGEKRYRTYLRQHLDMEAPPEHLKNHELYESWKIAAGAKNAETMVYVNDFETLKDEIIANKLLFESEYWYADWRI